jgi:hypothetical protein
MRLLTAMRPALLDPDAIGSFPDLAPSGRPESWIGDGSLDAAGALFLLNFPLLVGVLAMRSPRAELSLASPVP